MLRVVTLVIVGIAAVYSVVALACWALLNAPFAGLAQLPAASVALIPVLLPYALILVTYKLSVDQLSRWSAIFVSVAAALIASLLYWPSFAPNDGEYGIVFFLAPIAQCVFALPALGFSIWRRLRSTKRTPNHGVQPTPASGRG